MRRRSVDEAQIHTLRPSESRVRSLPLMLRRDETTMALDLRQLHDTTTRRFDRLVVSLMDSVGITFARSALGLVFIWFGALKTFGELSPAYDLVAATVYWFTPEIVVPILGIWEVLIGVAFLVPSRTRIALLLLLPQMPGTFLPLIMLPEVCFTVAPFGLTLEGQYIIKNLVIISCALIIGGTALRRTDAESTTAPSVLDSTAAPRA